MKYIIDAKKQRLGKVAREAAIYLMGKNRTDFAKNTVAEVKVEVINADLMDMTDKKKTNKYYLTYSGFPGGQKKETVEKLTDRLGVAEVVKNAVSGMLPKNKLRDRMMINLNVK